VFYAETASLRGLDVSMRHLQLPRGFDWIIGCFCVIYTVNTVTVKLSLYIQTKVVRCFCSIEQNHLHIGESGPTCFMLDSNRTHRR